MFSLNKKSFTLLELVMAMLMLAIVAVAGVHISFGNIRHNRLIAASQKLMFDIRYAQQLAISKQVGCGVVFNTSANSYYVFINNTSTQAEYPFSGEDLMVDYNSEEEFLGVSLTSTDFQGQIVFDFMGIPEYSNGTRLSSEGNIVLHSGSYSETVIIEPNTGQVRVQ